jgi:hypothetical protein
MMEGIYTGFYKYDSERIQQKLGRSQTFFDLEISEVDGDKFGGTVQEESVGQPGPGTITGELKGNHISFVKQMDIACAITPDGGQKTYNSKHPKIFYDGVLLPDGKYVGNWKIKFGFLFIGILPIPIPTTSGTWEMRRK